MRLLGVIIMTMASVLLFHGVALAHGSEHSDRVHAHHNTSKPAETEAASSSHTGHCHGSTIATSLEMMFDASSRTGAHDVTGDWNTRDDWDQNDDCCGVACHAVVGSKGDDKVASVLPSSPFALAGASELLGIKQRRLERPPRRFW